MQAGQGQRAATGGVEPLLGVGELGRRPELGQRGRLDSGNRHAGRGADGRQGGLTALAHRKARRGPQRREPVLDRGRALQRSRRADQKGRQARVPGQRLLEAHVEVGDHHHRRAQQDHAQRPLDQVTADRAAHPVGHGPAAESVEQHHGAESDRKREGHRHDTHRGAAGGADRGHGGQDRACARGADEAQGAPDPDAGPEAAAARPRAEAPQPGERSLDALGQWRHQQDHAEAEQDHDRQRPGGAAGQPDTLDQLGERHDRDRERQRQAEHDPGRATAAAARTGG